MDLHRIFTLDGVVTLVDAVNGAATLDTQEESVKQAAIAERIVLSKTDLADNAAQTALKARLKALNPGVDIIHGNHGEVSFGQLFGIASYDPYNKSRDVKEWLAAEKYEDGHSHHHDHDHHHHDVNRHGDNINAFAMTSDKPISSVAFAFFLDNFPTSMHLTFNISFTSFSLRIK